MDDIAKKYDLLMSAFKENKLDTWFDMGLFLDQIKDERTPVSINHKSYKSYLKDLKEGIAFITFDYGIDGVSIEITKYCNALERLFSEDEEISEMPNIHWVGGHFYKETEIIKEDRWKAHVMPEIWAFDEWDGYKEFFHTKLKRGSKEYNDLAEKLISQTEKISSMLGKLILDHNIKLLVPVNSCSNPGNVALAFSLAMISEYMDVQVLGNHHDFYFENGKRENEYKKGEKRGVRDHFFTNTHLGEVFSMIEMLYPWESDRWAHVVINTEQRKKLIREFGHDPVSLRLIPTSISLGVYRPYTKDEQDDVRERLSLVFSKGSGNISTKSVYDLLDDCIDIGLKGDPLYLGFENNISVNLDEDNYIFLQPTRIIKRKRIELNFALIKGLLEKTNFKKLFDDNPKRKITLFITGPIANQQGPYFKSVVEDFKKFLKSLSEKYQKRIFLACTFGLENKKVLNDLGLTDLLVQEVYGISSLTALLSLTEGRGLPIIESSASGVPMVCNRYHPEHVYKEVVGVGMGDKELKVFDFKGDSFKESLLNNVSNLFTDVDSYNEIKKRNREIVKKRYSDDALVKTFKKVFYTIYERSVKNSNDLERVKDAITENEKGTKKIDLFKNLVLSKNRFYLPGLTKIEFIIYLKSLIDPSFFRIEEMHFRGRVMNFAEKLIQKYSVDKKFDRDKRKMFFKRVREYLEYYDGDDQLAIDHSLSYRHRNRRHYPYRKLTEPEILGIVGILFREIISSERNYKTQSKREIFFKGPKSAMIRLVGGCSGNLKIDDFKRLEKDILSRPFGFFPSSNFVDELTIFAERVLKSKFVLESMTDVTFFAREKDLLDVKYDDLVSYIESGKNKILKKLYEQKRLKVVKTLMISDGINLAQLGDEALKVLIDLKNRNGFVIASGYNSFMLDMIDLESYRFASISDQLHANFMGLEVGDSYIQWVPRALKPSLSYPTPIQTPSDFSKILKSDLYKKCVTKHGEKNLLEILRKDADSFGNPISSVLKSALGENEGGSDGVYSTKINGIHSDGLPWSGAYIRVTKEKKEFEYNTVFADRNGQTVLELIKDFEKKNRTKVKFAWNGGYILNPELVGKLSLPEDYIGSPLGLVCSHGKINALPMYNKSALLIMKDGSLKLDRVNLDKGFKILSSGAKIEFSKESKNAEFFEGPSFFDLLNDRKFINGKDRVVYRLVGNRVIEIIKDKEDIEVIPVGIVLSFPLSNDPLKAEKDDLLDFSINGLEEVLSAIEAGPMLITNGEVDIDMVKEGWKTNNSIVTQAARLDYTDMRGPKIGVGITGAGELILIAINGRIRESVGATHTDLAKILKDNGAVTAMGFDPGGSTTLVIDGVQQNISPYNKYYEDNNFSLPPMPRTVGNAVLGV